MIRCVEEALLPDCEKLNTDKALDSMRGKAWFEEIVRTACS